MSDKIIEEFFSQNSPIVMVVALAVGLWSLYWKGRALWKAARLGSRNWFIALLLINFLGILDILYIYKLSERKPVPQVPTSQV